MIYFLKKKLKIEFHYDHLKKHLFISLTRMNNQHIILKSFKTILEMLNDRKIDVNGIDENLIAEQIKQNASKIGFEIKINNINVIYYLSQKFKWTELRKIIDEDRMEPNFLHIFIVNDKISASNMKSLNALNINMQIFNIKELQFNITRHVLVPKHELITNQEEIDHLMKTFSLKSKSQLPLILKSDPVSRYFGLKSGDIVKITRVSPSSGEYFIYRCCM